VWKWPVVKYKHIKIKPIICVLFILCLTWTVNANSLKQNTVSFFIGMYICMMYGASRMQENLFAALARWGSLQHSRRPPSWWEAAGYPRTSPPTTVSKHWRHNWMKQLTPKRVNNQNSKVRCDRLLLAHWENVVISGRLKMRDMKIRDGQKCRTWKCET